MQPLSLIHISIYPCRKQIWVQAKFMGFHRNTAAETRLIAAENTFYHSIEPKFLKTSVVRLDSHTAVVVKDIGFFAIVMNHGYQFFTKFDYKIIDKIHPVSLRLSGGHMRDVIFPLIYKIFRGQTVSICLGK